MEEEINWKEELATKAKEYLEKASHDVLWRDGTKLTKQRGDTMWEITEEYRDGYFVLRGKYGIHVQRVMQRVDDLQRAMGGGYMRDLVPGIHLGDARLNLPKVELSPEDITSKMEKDLQGSNIPFWKEGVGQQFSVLVDITGKVIGRLHDMSLVPKA